MYVNRMRLYGVKSLLRRALPPEGEFPEPVRRRLLLQGPNGSGKSTILEAIVALWQLFGEWIDAGVKRPPPPVKTASSLAGAELAAMEFCDFAKGLGSLWIAVGKANAIEDLRREFPQSAFATLRNFGARKSGNVKWSLDLPTIDLSKIRNESLVGSVPQSNVVYFPPEERTVLPAKATQVRLVDMSAYNWSAVFDAKLDLDSLLMSTKAHSPQRYAQTLELINSALQRREKRIVAAGQSGRHVVEISADGKALPAHTLDQLSSGEKQVLLLIAFVVCTLRPGGIVIIDEPDLHMHISIVQQLIETLGMVIKERHGQFIVASHSQLVWNCFPREAERIQLGPWRKGA